MEFLQGFNWFDLVLAAIVLLLGIKGFINGLVREVFGLVGLIGGVIVASRFNTVAAELISEHVYKFEKSAMADFIGFLALFIGFWLVCLGLGALVRKLVGLSGLGFVDRIGGFIAGSAKVFLIFAVLLAVLMRINFLGEAIKPVIGNSYAYPLLLKTGAWVLNIDAAKLNEKINEHMTSSEQKQQPDQAHKNEEPKQAQDSEKEGLSELKEPTKADSQNIDEISTQSQENEIKQEQISNQNSDINESKEK